MHRHARLIIEEARKKRINAKAYELYNNYEQSDIDTSHTYVVLDNQKDDDLPLNIPIGIQEIPTVGIIRAKGTDITDTLLNTPWDKLR